MAGVQQYDQLDALGAPNNYVAPLTQDDTDYIKCFFEVCTRYNIDIGKADQYEREFVMQQTERMMKKKRLEG